MKNKIIITNVVILSSIATASGQLVNYNLDAAKYFPDGSPWTLPNGTPGQEDHDLSNTGIGDQYSQGVMNYWADGVAYPTEGSVPTDCFDSELFSAGVTASNPNDTQFLLNGSDGSGNIDPNGTYHCFYGWADSPTDPNSSFNALFLTANFAADAVGVIDNFTFDVSSYYGGASGALDANGNPVTFTNDPPSDYLVRVWTTNNGATTPIGQQGNLIQLGATQFGGLPVATQAEGYTDWQHIDIDLSSYGLTSSIGSTDSYFIEFQAYGGNGGLGLDHLSLHGSIDCIPEPSNTLLLGLSALTLLGRKRNA